MVDRFVKLADGWIKDTETNLEWWPESKSMNWENAHVWAKKQGGRLPNLRELQSLIDYDCLNNISRLKEAGFICRSYFYWSGTTYAPDMAGAWYVEMSYGIVDFNFKTFKYYVWTVRG